VESATPDIRINQEWQLSDGRRVTVQTIEGSQVTGYHPPLALPGSGPPPGGSVVAFVGNRANFDGAVLLAPRWELVADIEDDGRPEEVSRLLLGTATVESRSSFALDPEDPEKGPTPPRYTLSLAAADEAAAETAVREALGDRLKTLRGTKAL
jgi:hypothetical protein